MSRFHGNTASERKREAFLAQQTYQLLVMQCTWNEIKLLTTDDDDDDDDDESLMEVDDDAMDADELDNMSEEGSRDSELSDITPPSLLSLSMQQGIVFDDSTDTSSSDSSSWSDSSSSESDIDSLHLTSSESESDDDDFDFLLGAMLSQSFYSWMQARRKMNIPIEVPGVVDWGRRLVMENVTEAEAVRHFRFRKADLMKLINELWIPLSSSLNGTCDKIIVAQQYTVPFETGMLLLLYRMAHMTPIEPEMEDFLGMHHHHIECVLETFSDALCSLALAYLSNPLLLSPRFGLFAEKLHQKFGLLDRVWGFIDATFCETCQPSHFQTSNDSSHKRSNGIQFQSVMTPDGFFGHFYGPTKGNRPKVFILGESRILKVLAKYRARFDQPYALFGNPDNTQNICLGTGIRNPPNHSDIKAFHTAMSQVRESVEWGFGQITQTWPFLSQKNVEVPVARYFILGAFLCNLRNCFDANYVSTYFDCPPLSLEEYLGLLKHVE